MSSELLTAYDEYCVDCYAEGIVPKPFWAWLWEGDE